jgi:short-subunit dehydrogenase
LLTGDPDSEAGIMGDWALITGASAGIGVELAKLFAADHFNLALVARNEQRLKKLGEELRTQHAIEFRVIARDLADPTAPAQIYEALRGISVSILVNNAGLGRRGAFANADPGQTIEMMRVNMEAVVQLTHLFVQPMLARREGRILNVASTAAFQPGPLTNIYYASKAFVFSFSVALAEELADTGVSVTTLCPGGTRTEFHQRAGMQRSTKLLRMMTAESVARIGYRALMARKGIVVPGVFNKLTSAVARRLPAPWMARAVKRINQT